MVDPKLPFALVSRAGCFEWIACTERLELESRVALTGASTACDKGLPEGPQHRSVAEALGLGHQIVKPACRLLSAAAPAMGSKSASISHEEVDAGQRFRPRIVLERGAIALRAVPVPGAQRRVN